ncbi:MAG TPA: efflux RND transporter periplasmic adaptor subunit [Inquilinus sp.]|nr:efflux RND transporter periplasmic adaptor subunit [Inquilinus sp.]
MAAIAAAVWYGLPGREAGNTAQAAVPPAPVTVSKPLQRDVDTQIGMLGQFSAVDRVELRAQVGGTLAEILFEDGQIVRKGDLLFVIDPTPYEIRLAQATAQLTAAQSRLALANSQLYRAQALKRTDFGTAENVDQRTADMQAAQAAIDDAKAQIRDAQFDIDHSRIVAPFSGRIGAHQVSVGSLVAGSRFASSPTTLLATLVSLDPIHLDFDMSESDYLAFARQRTAAPAAQADKVDFSLADETRFARQGTLEFVDNVLDRSSGTIHARALVANPDLFLTPGQFARLRLAVAPPAPAMLVPDAAVLLDQSQRIVLTVDGDGTVVPKTVETGDLHDGLRVIRSGLAADDRVIIDGIVRAVPGGKVAPQDGSIIDSAATGGQG